MDYKADYLVTGDKDLLELDKIGSSQIVSAIEFDFLIPLFHIQE